MASTRTELASATPVHPYAWLSRQRLRWLVGILAGLTIAAVGASIEAGRRTVSRPAPLVMVVPITSGSVTGTLKAEGALAAVLETTAAPAAGGRVIDLPVRPGDEVRRGQVLARLDPLAARAEQARAEAALVSAEVTAFEAELRLGRVVREARQLELEGLATEEDQQLAEALATADARYARALALVNAAEANFRLARHRRKETSIVAPVDGVVVAMGASLGQVLEAGAPAVRIAGRSEGLKVVAHIDESALSRVRVGQRARLTVPAFPGRVHEVRLDRIGGIEVQPDGYRQVALDLGLLQPAADLRPGMSAALLIETRSEPGTLRVPLAALQFSPAGRSTFDERPSVWLVEGPGTGSALSQVAVEVGASDGERVEVRGPGLRKGAGVAVGYATTRAGGGR